jgi:hypothetical protein
MRYQFVTSMHKLYYDHIGQVMIAFWLKHYNRSDKETWYVNTNIEFDEMYFNKWINRHGKS